MGQRRCREKRTWTNYVVRMDDAQVEPIDRGEAEWNKMVFNAFLKHKVEIEELFGGPLDWQLLPEKRKPHSFCDFKFWSDRSRPMG